MTDKERLIEWLKQHKACAESREWAIRECGSLREAWERAPAEWLVWGATRQGVLDERTLRLFACWSVRQVWHLLTDERSQNAVIVAERYADGSATDAELDAAMSTARSTARSAAMSAAMSAAWSAAWSAQANWLRSHAKLCDESEVANA